MIAYITKHALNSGIEEVECRLIYLGIHYPQPIKTLDGREYSKHDYELTMDDAIIKAENMRLQEINRLKNLKFTP